MELEEMKNTWATLSEKVEKQQAISQQLIDQITSDQYRSNLKMISLPEYIGTVICYMGSGYLAVNFLKIESSSIQILAIGGVILLLVIPIISLISLRAIQQTKKIGGETLLEAVNTFGEQKVRFQKLQKLNVWLALILIVIATPILSAIQGKELDDIPYFWTLIVPIGVIFFLAFALWVMRRYNTVLLKTEQMLEEINN